MADLAITSPPPSSGGNFFFDPLETHPSWFKPPVFFNPQFDSESFISDLRTFVPFDTLRSELHAHFSSLNRELVDSDYSDFVSLSTKLVDVDAAALRMRAPLLELREKIQGSRKAVEGSLVSLENGLTQRLEAASAREVLELLLNASHVVSKVEKLIKELPSVPSEWLIDHTNSTEKNSLSDGTYPQHLENGTNLRETQSLLLARIATEMNSLKFHIAQAQDLPFIQDVERRIHGASLLLDASLGQCFVGGLKHRDATAICNCLRAYAALDDTESAEEIFRTTFVAPLIQKFVPCGLSGLVDESAGDDLGNDYQQIKKCIQEDCKFLLEIPAENCELQAFDFLANSILREVMSAIQKGKPGSYSPGRPAIFLENYRSSLDFMDHLEGYCPSRSAVIKFRANPVYIDFMKLWNLGVYFYLRFQEIAGALDSVLASPSLILVHTPESEQRNSQDLTLRQSVALLESLTSCWDKDVLVISSSDKFLRLSLQLLSRYVNWLTSGLAAWKNGSAGSCPGCEWAVSAAANDFVYIIHDLDCLVKEISGIYLDNVLDLLSSCSPEVLDLVRKSILQGAKSLSDLVPAVIKAIVDTLVDASSERLKPLREMTATYMIKNNLHQHLVGVLDPLKAFLHGKPASAYLTSKIAKEVMIGAATAITDCYKDLVSEVISVGKKFEHSIQICQQASAQKQSGASSYVKLGVLEINRTKTELVLDIQNYGRELAALGVEVAKFPAYQSLCQSVGKNAFKSTDGGGDCEFCVEKR